MNELVVADEMLLSSKLTTGSILLRIQRDKRVSWGPFAFSHLFQDLVSLNLLR